ncbi:MAG: hypothetical protein K5866_04890 [Treponema sp.]|nr:hypothetical protein [Treponema sp.]
MNKNPEEKLKTINPIQFYINRYNIPKNDMTDYSEANRFHMVIVSFLVALFGTINLIAYLIINYKDLKKASFYISYYSFLAIISILSLVAGLFLKKIKNQKSNLLKNIPVYIMYYAMILLAIYYRSYNYLHTFNAFIIFITICSLALCFFYVDPILFLIGQLLGLAFLSKNFIKFYGLSAFGNVILISIILFCLCLYKRKIEKKHFDLLKNQKSSLKAITFGNFTLFYKDQLIKFSRSKSTELLAYLIYKNGSSANTKELISVLWGDHADSSKYGSSFRNLVVDIKRTLTDLGIQQFFIYEYNSFRINTNVIQCDYYDFLEGDKKAISSYAGEFMNQYSWAEDVSAFLDLKISNG